MRGHAQSLPKENADLVAGLAAPIDEMIRSGLNMEKSENSKDELKYQIVVDEIERVKKLIEGHKKLLIAIGKL